MSHLQDTAYLLVPVKPAQQVGVPHLCQPVIRFPEEILLVLHFPLQQVHYSRRRLQMETEKTGADRVSGRPLPWAPARSLGNRHLAGLRQLHPRWNANARAWASVINGCMKRAEDCQLVVVSFKFHSLGRWASFANERDICNFGLEPHIVKICHGVRYNRESISFIHHQGLYSSFAVNLSL